jgi:hypothetical protein
MVVFPEVTKKISIFTEVKLSIEMTENNYSIRGKIVVVASHCHLNESKEDLFPLVKTLFLLVKHYFDL